jgi:anhydro-N-acetylmuramic acid kinase
MSEMDSQLRRNDSELYIGLMSGTSADGIDAALVDFSNDKPRVVSTLYTPYDASVRKQILDLCQSGYNEIKRMGELDVTLGKALAHAVNELLEKNGISASNIIAIGSHGQTIRHSPQSQHRFTLQIGDPNTIAALTGMTTVADFRRKDIALGGQGAPLVPAFHQQVFTSADHHRVIVNIGGIANITLLPKNKSEKVLGFDTGPGNVLFDAWIYKHQQKQYDKDGEWAAQGKVIKPLLEALLKDSYFSLPAPKSTGREYFNLNWLSKMDPRISGNARSVDVQTTLVELTAITIVDAIKQHFTDGEIFICGGGAHNQLLMSRLKALSQPNFQLGTTAALGIDPDWVEAIAFAWLAKRTLHRQTSNLPEVTGASAAAVLCSIHY